MNPIQITGDLFSTDPVSVVVSFTNTLDDPAGLGVFEVSGTPAASVTVDPSGIEVQITGTITEVNSALQNLRFVPSADQPDDLNKSFEYKVVYTDAASGVNTETGVFTVGSVHFEWAVTNVPLTYDENTPFNINYEITDLRPDNIDPAIEYEVKISSANAEVEYPTGTRTSNFTLTGTKDFINTELSTVKIVPGPYYVQTIILTIEQNQLTDGVDQTSQGTVNGVVENIVGVNVDQTQAVKWTGTVPLTYEEDRPFTVGLEITDNRPDLVDSDIEYSVNTNCWRGFVRNTQGNLVRNFTFVGTKDEVNTELAEIEVVPEADETRENFVRFTVNQVTENANLTDSGQVNGQDTNEQFMDCDVTHNDFEVVENVNDYQPGQQFKIAEITDLRPDYVDPAIEYEVLLESDINFSVNGLPSTEQGSPGFAFTISGTKGIVNDQLQRISVPLNSFPFNVSYSQTQTTNDINQGSDQLSITTNEWTVTFDIGEGTRVGGGQLVQNFFQGSDLSQIINDIEPIVERDGFRVSNWLNVVTNLQSDITIVAEYVEVFEVNYNIGSATLISGSLNQIIDINESAQDPIIEKSGVTFSNWAGAVSQNITNDTSIACNFVTFDSGMFGVIQDANVSSSIDIQLVLLGNSASLPVVNVNQDETFENWSVDDLSNITQDVEVFARYTYNKEIIKVSSSTVIERDENDVFRLKTTSPINLSNDRIKWHTTEKNTFLTFRNPTEITGLIQAVKVQKTHDNEPEFTIMEDLNVNSAINLEQTTLPVISPSGEYLAVIVGPSNHNQSIYIYDLSVTDNVLSLAFKQQITATNVTYSNLAFSPDSEMLYYYQSGSGSLTGSFSVTKQSNGLFSNQQSQPIEVRFTGGVRSFSSTGSYALAGTNFYSHNNGSFILIDDQTMTGEFVSWSRSGEYVFADNGQIIKIDNGQINEITNNTFSSGRPFLSDDENFLVVSSTSGGSSSTLLYNFDISGLSLKPIINLRGNEQTTPLITTNASEWQPE